MTKLFWSPLCNHL